MCGKQMQGDINSERARNIKRKKKLLNFSSKNPGY